MNWYKRNRTMMEIIDHYGVRNQMNKCIEELDELKEVLIEGLARGAVGDTHITEEIADVIIMARQMAIIFDLNEKVEEAIDYKLNRQLKRMEEGK